jgi:hypothetical protein
MAREKGQRNGKLDRLDEAMTALVESQAQLLQNQAVFEAQLIEIQRLNAERFARIEQRCAQIEAILLEHSRILADHSRILAEHSRILEALPDALREKIGFKPPSS